MEQTTGDLGNLINLISRIREIVRPVYDEHVRCSLFFGPGKIYERFEIPESAKEEVERAIGALDSGTPSFDWYEGYLYSVTINNPWG